MVFPRLIEAGRRFKARISGAVKCSIGAVFHSMPIEHLRIVIQLRIQRYFEVGDVLLNLSLIPSPPIMLQDSAPGLPVMSAIRIVLMRLSRCWIMYSSSISMRLSALKPATLLVAVEFLPQSAEKSIRGECCSGKCPFALMERQSVFRRMWIYFCRW